MATYTQNLGLKKPAGSDYVMVSDLNENMNILDTAIGDPTQLSTDDKASLVRAINAADKHGLPSGGVSGQMLIKKSDSDYDAAFETVDAGSVGAVPITRKLNGHLLDEDVDLTSDDVGAVPVDRMLNGHKMDEDIDLDADDVGAISDDATINKKPLSTNPTLTATDVDAVAYIQYGNVDIYPGEDGKVTLPNDAEKAEAAAEAAAVSAAQAHNDKVAAEAAKLAAEAAKQDAALADQDAQAQAIKAAGSASAAQTAKTGAEIAANQANQYKVDAQTAAGESKQDYDALSGRVDNLINGVTVDSEVIDIRTDPWGNAYPVAGDLTRYQGSLLDTKASGLTSHTDTNPAVIVPAAGSHITVTADRDCGLMQSGRNMLKPSSTSRTLAGVTIAYDVATGLITAKGTATQTGVNGLDVGSILPPGIYTASATFSKNTAAWYIGYYNESGSTWVGDINSSNPTKTFAAKQRLGTMGISIVSGITYDVAFYLQLELGSVTTSYTPFVALNTYNLLANAPTVIPSISGTNCLYADSSAQLTTQYNRDSMDFVRENLIPVSNTAPVAQIKGCVSGLPMDVTMRCVAMQTGTGDPSPDNIRPITGKNTATVYRSGKNLLPISPVKTATRNGITITEMDDSSFVFNGTNTGSAIYPDLTWNISRNSIASDKNAVMLYGTQARITTNVLSGSYTSTTQWLSAYCNPIVGGPVIPQVRIADGGLVLNNMYSVDRVYLEIPANAIFNNWRITVQCELGSTATSYVPYVKPGIYPVAFGETVYGMAGAPDEVRIDSDGKVWWMQYAKYVSYNGSENWTWNADGYAYILLPSTGSSQTSMITTHFPVSVTGLPRAYLADPFRALYFWPGNSISGITDTASLKAWLADQYAAGTPFSALYKLATPITTPIGRISPIPSRSGTNTAWSDGGGDTTIAGWQGLRGLADRTATLETAVKLLTTTGG